MKISVLTPSFNSEKTLQKAIDSVKLQTYKHWEHIIVDGNSKDGTKDILKANNNITWVSEQDKGQSEAMNKAFKMSTGDLIVYLNSDDYFYPNAFNVIVNAFKKNPDVDIIVGNLDSLRDDKKTPSANATISWKDLSILKGRFPLNPLSYFYKRKVQEKVGNFPINEHYTMDYWFLLRAFYFFKPIKINDYLGCFVFLENNKSSTIVGEYQIQKPHALRFCLQNTPTRFFYVYFKLFVHPKNPNLVKKVIKKFYKKIFKNN